LNGVIVLNKPLGKTSHDMVYFIRKLTGIKKVGHTGTLDPYAEGVLPICIGNATKAADMITAYDKKYRAEMILGRTTDTQDAQGKVLTKCEVNLDRETIIEYINKFIGETEQIPPMYSAVKVNGRKLYELAREGMEVERKARKIIIYSIDILSIENNIVTIDVLCSKGTYIRTLCEDIGNSLCVGAYMNKLKRLKSGSFTVENSYTCEELIKLKEEDRLEEALIKTEDLFTYDRIYLKDIQAKRLKDGVRVSAEGTIDGKSYRVYDSYGNFLSVSKCQKGRLVMKKSFWN